MTMDEDTARTPTGLPVGGTPQRADDAPDYSSAPGPVVPVPVVPANQPPKRRGAACSTSRWRWRRSWRSAASRSPPGGRPPRQPAQAARRFNGNGGFSRNGGSFDPGAGGGNGQGPRFAFGAGGALAIDGTVTAVTANSITIKRADGQEVTFDVTGTTAYHQATTAAAADVAVGDSVSVRVAPDGRLGGGGQGGQAGATASGDPTLSAGDVTVTH